MEMEKQVSSTGERSGVSGWIAAAVALLALGIGLMSGLILGAAGGYMLARGERSVSVSGPLADAAALEMSKKRPSRPTRALRAARTLTG